MRLLEAVGYQLKAVLGTGTLDAAGVAHFISSGLAHGTYTVTASYRGDSTHATSSSAAQTLTVITPVGAIIRIE